MSFGDYLKGQQDARLGMRNPMGSFSYHLGHASEERWNSPSRWGARSAASTGSAGAGFTLPGWVGALAKWTALLGFLGGAVGMFLLLQGEPGALGIRIAFIAGAGLVGMVVGWLLPFVVVGGVILLVNLVLLLLTMALVLLALLVLVGLVVFVASKFVH